MTKNTAIKARFVLFCDNAFNSTDGKLNIIGEFNQIYSTQEKPVLNRGFVVASFKGEPGSKADFEVRLASEKDEDVVPRQVLTVTFAPGGGANILIEINGLVFPKAGVYRATFKVKGKLLAYSEVIVSRVQQQSPAAS